MKDLERGTKIIDKFSKDVYNRFEIIIKRGGLFICQKQKQLDKS